MTESSQLAEAIAALGLGVDVAEFHGGICGLLCVRGPGAVNAWMRGSGRAAQSQIGDSTATSDVLYESEAESWHQLTGPELAFYPLLPDGDAPLEERVAALASWCQGFVTGLGLGGYRADRPQASAGDRAQIAEILADFVEISRAQVDEAIDRGAAAGFDLAALIEYVRVGAQLVFEALENAREPSAPGPAH